jgi:epoxide hydrolase
MSDVIAADAVLPLTIAVPESDVEDLRRRLAATRFPPAETVDDWSQGAPLAGVEALVEYWRTEYDWRRCEARLNELGQFRTNLDGVDIWFIHVRSPHADARPLVLTHGWPGSALDFLGAIPALVDPTGHGGTEADAFHVVVPSLPGYGFSGKPSRGGWGLPRIARAWAELMHRLGYDDYIAQGGDWGAGVVTHMARQEVRALAGIHLNFPVLIPPPLPDAGEPTAEEAEAMAALDEYSKAEMAYAIQQMTRPQTLGYGLADSPVGQAAWIYEKLAIWSGSYGDPEPVLTFDQMLDTISLYWLTNSGASSARLYWESFAGDFSRAPVAAPVGVTLFGGDAYRPPRIWGERVYSDLVQWNTVPAGGHFPALEQPEAFVAELRLYAAALRARSSRWVST